MAADDISTVNGETAMTLLSSRPKTNGGSQQMHKYVRSLPLTDKQ